MQCNDSEHIPVTTWRPRNQRPDDPGEQPRIEPNMPVQKQTSKRIKWVNETISIATPLQF